MSEGRHIIVNSVELSIFKEVKLLNSILSLSEVGTKTCIKTD